ncbi:MAG TPA: tRNA pseudouridine(55) synthase TruB [Kiritimatiellia bacterium]|nr:tRNA pseudouridine(55) synthase TruB [Kiritimatiellia bacterium]
MSERAGGRRFSPGPTRTLDPWDGVLLVDKPPGWTSHDVVNKIRNRFKIKKVGHGGTLDPMATGLLLILTGRGTKLSGEIMGSDKEYEGEITLGSSTTTQDAEGDVVEARSWEHVDPPQLAAAMAGLTGDQMQMPPMVSAIKKDGVPLYKLARKGETVEREPRFIHVYEFRMLEADLPRARFRVKCTKGTYVRTLCHDIGETLGCGAHLSGLRRTASGPYRIEQAHGLEDVVGMTEEQLWSALVPLHQARLLSPLP